ncbi:MAG TPA: hypothetical protein VGL26_10205 [Jatrophihabitans sp.]|jgi:dsDNA-specific endonuclease/ATPase MutS2
MALADKAKDLASRVLGKAQDLEKKAEPYVGKAKDTAEDLAQKASPHVQMAVKRAGTLLDQAGDKISQGVNTLANQLDKDKKPVDSEEPPVVDPAGIGDPAEPATETVAEAPIEIPTEDESSTEEQPPA